MSEAKEASEQVAVIVTMARGVDMAGVEALLDECRRFDTVTSMLDPTRWMRENAAMDASGRVLMAFVAFRKAIDEVAA